MFCVWRSALNKWKQPCIFHIFQIICIRLYLMLDFALFEVHWKAKYLLIKILSKAADIAENTPLASRDSRLRIAAVECFVSASIQHGSGYNHKSLKTLFFVPIEAAVRWSHTRARPIPVLQTSSNEVLTTRVRIDRNNMSSKGMTSVIRSLPDIPPCRRWGLRYICTEQGPHICATVFAKPQEWGPHWSTCHCTRIPNPETPAVLIMMIILWFSSVSPREKAEVVFQIRPELLHTKRLQLISKHTPQGEQTDTVVKYTFL
jgi:hypothetical protein